MKQNQLDGRGWGHGKKPKNTTGANKDDNETDTDEDTPREPPNYPDDRRL